VIAAMVGIVGILLLGSLFWSAMGSLLGALGQATQSLPVARPGLSLTIEPTVTPRPAPTPLPLVVPTRDPTPPPPPPPTPTAPPPEPTRIVEAPTAVPTAAPTAPAPSPTASGRAPWVLLPLPAPGSKVAPGSVTLEARARGDAPIAQIQLELDGAALSVNMEQRAENTWRGAATARVTPGEHAARVVVVDAEGRRGAYRWTFEAAP
jgi:hypothetical protein